ncbi:MAG: PIN domain-containing protein [Terriglobales bacterium]
MKYVVDTCIFNKLRDGKLQPSDLPSDGRLVVTHIQVDEINNTSDKELRARLILAFAGIAPEIVPTETFLYDVSRLDRAKMGNGEVFLAVKTALDGREKKRNNTQDALIAEVAIVNGFTLLTSDRNLADVALGLGANIRFFDV